MSKNDLTIERVEHAGGHVLRFRFSDGHRNEVDFTSWIEGLPTEEERAYLEPKRFKKYRIHLGHAIMWGDYDIMFPLVAVYHGDPDLLEDGVPVRTPSRTSAARGAKAGVARASRKAAGRSAKRSKVKA